MTVSATFVRSAPEPILPPPPRDTGGTMRHWLFGSLANLLTTLVIVAVAQMALPHLLAWAVTHGVWQGGAADCQTTGACWIFLREKAPFILFGIYPENQQWRPVAVVTILVALAVWTMPRAHWTRKTGLAWGVGIAMCVVLMAGGVGGGQSVPTASWGGLPVTLLLAVFSLVFGFPIGLGLALSRRSRLPVMRWSAIGVIEGVRGVPVLTLLFVASVMAPLLLPEGVRPDHLMRAVAIFSLVSGAHIAEVLRGGLQGVATAQWESAEALGLRRRDVLLVVILPQAIRNVLPPLTSTIIIGIKNTSLVMVVGLFDLVSSGRVVLSDTAWPMPYAETYLMIAFVYFVICYGVARYALHLERSPSDLRAASGKA